MQRSSGQPDIGTPVCNTHFEIRARNGKRAPRGVAGELIIGGTGVAIGYHRRPALTEEKFIGSHDGGRAFRSGDLARWRYDGTLEHLGRMDTQFKLRGYRIEAGEIETALMAHERVSAAAVVVREDVSGDQRLVAYVVAAPVTPGLAGELQNFVKPRLPSYMVPSRILTIDALPLAATGKVDRRALAAMPIGMEHAATRVRITPRTTVEHQLVQLWQSLLGVSPIGITDDFFESGGHSLLAVRMLSEVERLTGRRVPLSVLFEHGTIARLAAHIERDVHEEPEPPMVLLNAGGSGAPFAFVHGDVRGGGWYCRALAGALGAQSPFVVLPTLRPEEGLNSVGEIAARHVQTLRSVQPSGPYRIGGYCAGGVIAFEMARQLIAAGESVDRVVLVDSRIGEPGERKSRWLRPRLAKLKAVARKSPAEQIEWVVRHAARLFGERHETDSRESIDDFLARPETALLQFHARAAREYEPQPYTGSIDLVVAVSEHEQLSDDGNGWNRIAASVRTHMIEGTHIGLITDGIDRLGAILRQILH